MTRILYLVGFLIVLTLAQDIDSNVKALTKENFDEALKSHPMTLVMFYDPNTDDFKSLQTEYGKAALQLISQNITNILLAKVDITKNMQILNRFDFGESPTFVLFDEDEQIDYDQQPIAANIVEWVIVILSPPFKVIETAEELEKEIKKEQAAKVFFYGKTEGPQFKTYERIAHLDRDNQYFVVSKPELIKNIWTPTVLIHASFHHPQSWKTYSGDWIKKNLSAWIQDVSLPVVVQLAQRTIKYIFDDKSTSIFLINAGSDSQAVLGIMETYCIKQRAFTCGQVTKHNPMFEAFTSFLDSPQKIVKSELMLLETKKRKMYRYKSRISEITQDLFDQWIADWKIGKLIQDNLDEEQEPPQEAEYDEPTSETKSYEKTIDL